MKINADIIRDVTGIEAPSGAEYNALGLLNDSRKNVLSFCEDEQYLDELIGNETIRGVIIKPALRNKLEGTGKDLLISEDPRYHFFILHNYLEKKEYTKVESEISSKATIHPTAEIANYNVIIGDQVTVGPHVTVLSDVEIQDFTIVEAGAVLGSEGFEYKRTSKGILPVFHGGKVVIGAKVEIGANTVIDKGISSRNTLVGDESKIDNLVHIAHGVHLGKRNLIAANASISGSVSSGDDVWIGPNVTISNMVTIGDGACVTIGSLVVKDVPQNGMAVGKRIFPEKNMVGRDQ